MTKPVYHVFRIPAAFSEGLRFALQEEDDEYAALLKPEANNSEGDDDARSWDEEDDLDDEDEGVDEDRSVDGLQDGGVRSARGSQMETTSPELELGQPSSSPLTSISDMSVDGQDGVDAGSARGSPMQTTSTDVGQPSSSPLSSVSHMEFSPLPSAQRLSPASVSSSMPVLSNPSLQSSDPSAPPLPDVRTALTEVSSVLLPKLSTLSTLSSLPLAAAHPHVPTATTEVSPPLVPQSTDSDMDVASPSSFYSDMDIDFSGSDDPPMPMAELLPTARPSPMGSAAATAAPSPLFRSQGLRVFMKEEDRLYPGSSSAPAIASPSSRAPQETSSHPQKRTPYVARESLYRKYGSPELIEVDITHGEETDACQGGWVGMVPHKKAKRTGYRKSLQKLIDDGFKVIPHDPTKNSLITDSEGRIITMITGFPSEDSKANAPPFSTVPDDVDVAISDLFDEVQWNGESCLPAEGPKDKKGTNRRGPFDTINIGCTMGMGSKRPSNFDHTPSNQAAIDKFLKNDAVRRLTKFVGTKMAFYQPRMTRLYTNTLEKVDTLHTAASKAFRTDLSESSAGGGRVAEANQVVQESWEGQSNQGGNVRAGGGGGGGGGGGINPPYQGDVFASMSVNAGRRAGGRGRGRPANRGRRGARSTNRGRGAARPSNGDPSTVGPGSGKRRPVISHVHRDQRNLAMGFCAITPIGRFDHTKGGHIVLHEAKLIIECPPGCTVYIPSATCTHYNTDLFDPENETRASIIHYSSAGLFRFVEYDGMTMKQMHETDPKKWQEKADEGMDRVDAFLALYTTYPEFRSWVSSTSETSSKEQRTQ